MACDFSLFKVNEFNFGSTICDANFILLEQKIKESNCFASEIELAGYDLSTSGAHPQPQWTGYNFDSWFLEAGIDLLDTTNPNNAAVLKDGIYTWHFHCRYVTADIFGALPIYPPRGQLKGNFARFELQLSTIGGPLFSDHGFVLPLEIFEGNGTFVTYPQASNSFRLPMRAGDTLNNPYVEHDVAGGDPNARYMTGGDMQVILLWEPLRKFPTI